MLRVRGNSNVLVQLGGLEPPTSCSTDRRSNQLSYNCILTRGPKKGGANGPETRCNASLWQGRGATDYSRLEDILGSFAGGFRAPAHTAKNPGQPPGLFVINTGNGSGGRLVKLRGGSLDRLDGLGRDLLAELGEFLGLRRKGLVLLLGM